MDLEHLMAWVGRTEERRDAVSATAVDAMAATLDRDDAPASSGDLLPPLWHWMAFAPIAPAHELGDDGHPRRGGFLPPVPLPRRMWAGSKLQFHRPLRVGETLRRRSKIDRVDIKQGRSGTLVFVTVEHAIEGAVGLALTEVQDIVYRDAPSPGQPAPAAAESAAAPAAGFERSLMPDPVLLFRYSALTFNGHRIHYDRPYATGVEGYPGLVVHGPLLATLLVDLLRRERPEVRLERFDFRAVRPLFDTQALRLQGRAEGDGRCALWTLDDQGRVTMQASAVTRDSNG